MSSPVATSHAASQPIHTVKAWWQAAPFAAVFVVFFLIPLALTLMVSFWNFNDYELIPGFTFRNYFSLFEGCTHLTDNGDICVTLKTYLSTLKFCLLVWGITLLIGFSVALLIAGVGFVDKLKLPRGLVIRWFTLLAIAHVVLWSLGRYMSAQ